MHPARLGVPLLGVEAQKVAYPSLLTRQWFRYRPSRDVRVDGCVAARAELGAGSFGVASPAPGLLRAGPSPGRRPAGESVQRVTFRAWRWQAGVG